MAGPLDPECRPVARAAVPSQLPSGWWTSRRRHVVFGVMANQVNSAGELLERYAAGESNFALSRLRGADLAGADLSGADLRGVQLTQANLRGADLSQADLGGALLGDADLSSVNLGGANLRGAILWRSNMTARMHRFRMKKR